MEPLEASIQRGYAIFRGTGDRQLHWRWQEYCLNEGHAALSFFLPRASVKGHAHLSFPEYNKLTLLQAEELIECAITTGAEERRKATVMRDLAPYDMLAFHCKQEQAECFFAAAMKLFGAWDIPYQPTARLTRKELQYLMGFAQGALFHKLYTLSNR